MKYIEFYKNRDDISMKLATTTYDFFGYVPSQFEMIECVNHLIFHFLDNGLL